MLHNAVDIDIEYYMSNAATRIFQTKLALFCCYKETEEYYGKGH